MAEVDGRKATILRLSLREYGPAIGWIVAWGIVAAAVGHADAARLVAATAFVRSARYLTSPSSAPALRRRLVARGRLHRAAHWTATIVELGALLGSIAALGLLICVLLYAGQQKVAQLCLILALTLPARTLLLFAAARKIDYYQSLLAWSGVLMAGAAWALGAELLEFAFVMAAREWVALGLALLAAKRRKPISQEVEPLHWREIADYSLQHSRRQFTYRVSKFLLKFVLGPFGGIAARTGRGFRMDRKLERFVPQTQSALAGMFATLTGIAAGIILFIPKPGLLMVGASLLRIGASAGNLLIWSKLGTGEVPATDDDDDDDD